MSDETGCAHCGGAVSGRGPAPSTGKRYCMAPLCQRERQRGYLQSTGNTTARVEDRPCSSCQSAMPIRSWRATDSELGRWCSRRACQRDRAAAQHDEALSRATTQQRLAGEIAAFRAAKIVHCPACGLLEARDRFTHPDQAGKPCDGTLMNGMGIDAMRPHLHGIAAEFWLGEGKRTYEPITTTPDTKEA